MTRFQQAFHFGRKRPSLALIIFMLDVFVYLCVCVSLSLSLPHVRVSCMHGTLMPGWAHYKPPG